MKRRDVGIALITLSLFPLPLALCCGVFGVSWLVNPTDEMTTGDGLGVLLCVALPLLLLAAGMAGGGIYTLRADRRERLRETVIKLAEENGGRVTPQEVALHSELDVEAAQVYLETLAARGICTREETEGGVPAYRFVGVGATQPVETPSWREWVETPESPERPETHE